MHIKYLKLFVVSIWLLSGPACSENRATVELLVVDDQGVPLRGVNVGMGFLSNTPNNDYEGVTNRNGKVTATGESLWGVKVYLKKKGYYDSFKRVGRGDQSLTMRLRPIIDPQPMHAKKAQVALPSKGEFFGYDFKVGDLVVPYGEGLNSHVRLKVEGDRKDLFNFEETLTVSFAQNDGIVQYDSEMAIRESKFQFPYLSPERGYQNKIAKYRKQWQIKDGYGYDSGSESEYERSLLGYAFRVNSEVDEHGNIVKANYGKIYGELLAVTADPNGSYGHRVDFTYAYNPTINERSLEFDTRRNLFVDLPPEIGVWDP